MTPSQPGSERTISSSGLSSGPAGRRRSGTSRQVDPPRARPACSIAAGLVADIKSLTLRIRELERQLDERVHEQAPQLLDPQGCGVLGAAKLLAETDNVNRFRQRPSAAATSGPAIRCSGPRSLFAGCSLVVVMPVVQRGGRGCVAGRRARGRSSR